MICSNCGSQLRDNAVFCPHCGNTVAPVATNAGTPGSGQTSHVQADGVSPATTPFTSPYGSPPAPIGSATPQKPKRTGLKVMGVILSITLAVGGGAFGMYQAVRAGIVPGVGPIVAQEPAATSPTSSSSEAEVAPQPPATSAPAETKDDEIPAATSPFDPYLGEWEGELYETDHIYYGHHDDYAATNHPMKLKVASIDDTGRLKAEVAVMYHGYDSSVLTTDVDSHDGDQVVTATDITTTFDSHRGSFEFRVDCGNPMNYIRVEVEAIETGNSALQYECEVKSYFDGDLQYTDTYFLSRKA